MVMQRLLVGLALAAAGCRGAEAKPTGAGMVDSVVPRDSAIARFQRGLEPVRSFEGGARSRNELVQQFATALERRNTAELRSLLLTPAEFGRLYYPSSPEGFAPYNLTPQLMWFLVEGRTEQGLRRLLERRSGKPLRVLGHRCEGTSRQGDNVVWAPCLVLRRGERGDTLVERLFGQIIEREGQYKFLSYGNKL